MLCRQLFDRESCTYTYLLADTKTKECLLIDPVIELVDRDEKLIRELGFELKYCLNTHVHADHITGSGVIKSRFKDCKSVLGAANTEALADVKLGHGEHLKLGKQVDLEVRYTPGHTAGCVAYVSHNSKMVFTGDTLMVRGCGRTDFQGGSSESLYKSVHEQIFTLPEEFLVYPAHDYSGRTVSSIAEEKKFNPRLTKDLAGFADLMSKLDLAYPKKIDVSLPANLVCGIHELIPKAADDEDKPKKKRSSSKK
jgi:sulfur dioxygenase